LAGHKGVTLHSPPAKLKFVSLSSKKQKRNNGAAHRLQIETDDSNAGALVIVPNTELVSQYLDFVMIRQEERDETLAILDHKEITHLKMLLSKCITPKDMSDWRLSPSIITQLKDNVQKFEQFLSSE
jgi:hypothetical protein